MYRMHLLCIGSDSFLDYRNKMFQGFTYTSLFDVETPSNNDSIAIHLIGNRPPCEDNSQMTKYTDSRKVERSIQYGILSTVSLRTRDANRLTNGQ